VVPGVGIIFDDFNGVIPDLLYVSNERHKQILVNGRLNGSPEIVIEIVSPSATNSLPSNFRSTMN
jgi:Uma2 family endonuclease